MFSLLTATDGKAPIATVEEEDDDVPGEHWSVFKKKKKSISSLTLKL